MSAIALVAAGFIVLTWLYDRAADTLSLLVNNWKFRHEGRGIARHATSTPDSGSRADSAGNLDTVGARNGGDRITSALDQYLAKLREPLPPSDFPHCQWCIRMCAESCRKNGCLRKQYESGSIAETRGFDGDWYV